MQAAAHLALLEYRIAIKDWRIFQNYCVDRSDFCSWFRSVVLQSPVNRRHVVRAPCLKENCIAARVDNDISSHRRPFICPADILLSPCDASLRRHFRPDLTSADVTGAWFCLCFLRCPDILRPRPSRSRL